MEILIFLQQVLTIDEGWGWLIALTLLAFLIGRSIPYSLNWIVDRSN